MTATPYPQLALAVVSNATEISVEELYVVWFCKTLKNWKALVSTDAIDFTYWEVTYNGETGHAYLDTYKKESNQAFDLTFNPYHSVP